MARSRHVAPGHCTSRTSRPITHDFAPRNAMCVLRTPGRGAQTAARLGHARSRFRCVLSSPVTDSCHDPGPWCRHGTEVDRDFRQAGGPRRWSMRMMCCAVRHAEMICGCGPRPDATLSSGKNDLDVRLSQEAPHSEVVVQRLPPDAQAAIADRHVRRLLRVGIVEPRVPRRWDADVAPVGEAHA